MLKTQIIKFLNKQAKETIVVIVGPTASGKTELALKIAKISGGEIVSADSRQIYRGMDIGTAKPNLKETLLAKHWLIDIKNPNQEYSVSDYKKDAIKAINKIFKAGKLPILVGGTGLYVDSVVKNLEIPKIKANQELRQKLEKEIEEKGLEAVFKKLVELDPEAAYIVDPKNPRRIVRALEIAILSGKPYSEQRKSGKKLFETIQIGLSQPVEILQKRIEKRTKQMLVDGLVGEVKELVKKYGNNVKPFDAIGYREIIEYLNSKTNIAQAEELINKNTRNYAKRQMTWFKKNKGIKWFSDSDKAWAYFIRIPFFS